jgi:hypothetical protein
MNAQLNLKELERKAFRSTYQDGLWDLYFGLIVICMSIFVYRPASGYSPLNIVMAVGTMGVAYLLFWAGKKYITLPRMGQVEFGAQRRKRKLTMIIMLSVVVLVQVAFLAFQLAARTNPELGAKLNEFLLERNLMDLSVASVGALFVGPSMILVAFYIDFPRGYYIAILMSLAVFLMILYNQPIYAILIGALIFAPGVALLVRFLQKYPLRREGPAHE